ncbi:hypothetical protein DRQ12_04055 [candidate division KSB1 bacterium]|nr:MAG: hypothetical protein DRQ12_04055 [candidate division KSB1 bacterium]
MKKIFFMVVLGILSIVSFHCATMSRRYTKPGLNIMNEKVGMAFINFSEYYNRELNKKITEAFLNAIRSNTLYEVVPLSFEVEQEVMLYRGMLLSKMLANPEYQAKLLKIGKKAGIKYFLLIYLDNLERTVSNDIYVNLLIQIIDAATGELVYQDRPRTLFNQEMIYRTVANFPGYFSPSTGKNPAEEFKLLEAQPDSFPGQSDYPNAGAIFLIDECNYEVNIGRANIFTPLTKFGNIYTTKTRHVAIKILNQRGMKYANVEIPFSPSTYLSKIEARTIRKDGTVVPLAEDQIHEVTYFPDYIFFSDIKAKKFTMPAVEEGCIVEYKYSITSENVAWWGVWEFQRSEPVLFSQLSFDLPAGLEYKKKLLGFETLPDHFQKQVADIEKWEQRGGYRKSKFAESPRWTTKYILRNLPALTWEEQMPPISDVVPQLRFFSATFGGAFFLINWYQVGKWYHDLIKETCRPDARIEDIVKDLTKDIQTREDKIKAIYHYVQENIRYVAKEIGIGSIKPQYAGEVLMNRYGDCKDCSVLMIAMLKETGIKAYPALLRTRNKGTFDKVFVSFEQFNHMIVCVPLDGKYLWLDPTSDICPYGELPWQDQGVSAFVIKEEPEFLKTPSSSAAENRIDSEITITILNDGSLQGLVKSTLYGQESNGYKTLLKKLRPRERKEWLKEFIASRYSGAILQEYSISNLDKVEKSLEMNFKFYAPDHVVKTADLFVLQPAILNHLETNKFSKVERIYPVVFNYPYSSVDKVSIVLPGGYVVKEMPKDVSQVFPFAEFSMSCSQLKGQIKYERKFSLKEVEIPVREYPRLREFFDVVVKSDRSRIVISK